MLHDLLLLLRFCRLRLRRHFRHSAWNALRPSAPTPKTTEPPTPAAPAPKTPETPKPAVPAPETPKPAVPAPAPSPSQVAHERLSRLEERFRAKQDAREARQQRWLQERLAAGEPDNEPSEQNEPEPAPPAHPEPSVPPPPPDYSGYALPSLDLLLPEGPATAEDSDDIERQRKAIQMTLDSFRIDAEVIGHRRGPRITLFKVRVARGIKVAAIAAYLNDFRMALAAASLRILAPMPGHDYVGFEVPNRVSDTVRARTSLASPAFSASRALLPVILGRAIDGEDVIFDLARAPHLLVAGATGSGKSVCLNNIIISLLYRFRPDELKLILVDPKIVEMSGYNALPHLLVPVITEVPLVVLALKWVIDEMQRRYRMLAKTGLRNLESFNARPHADVPILDDDGHPLPDRLPFIVVIIDELADIMLTEKTEVENALARIAQLSRAVGIHCIVATQRPSVNVITGIIKANFPTRIAFQVSSQIDSRTIIDGKGAEALLGRGDMLFKPSDALRMLRLQGAMVTDPEIDAIVRSCAAQGDHATGFDLIRSAAADTQSASFDGDFLDADEQAGEALIRAAIEIIIRDQKASISYLQRRLRIGYNKAASIIETLEQRGVIGPQIGSRPREILAASVEEAVGNEDY